MYSVFETYDETSKRSAFGTPDNWERGVTLYWPPKGRNINILRRNRAEPEDDWESTTNYKVLARNLPSFKACLAKERELELFSDSESANNDKKKKAFKRLHPVNANSSKLGLYDLSSEFETTTAKKKATDIIASSSKAVVHSIEIIKEATSIDASMEDSIDDPGEDNSHTASESIPRIDEVDITRLSFILDENTGDSIHLIVNESNEGDSINVDHQSFALDENIGESTQSTVNISDEGTADSSNLCNVIMLLDHSIRSLSDSIITKMNSFASKLCHLNSKVESLVTKQDALESKLNSLDKKIDSELKWLAALHVKVHSFSKNPVTTNTPIPEAPIPLNLPSATDEDVRQLVLTVKNDINVTQSLEKRLTSYGGDTARKCVYAIVAGLFEDDILLKYTWKGTTDKLPFEKLTDVNNMIKKCVRVRFPDLTDDVYKKDVQEYLKHASTRISRRYF